MSTTLCVLQGCIVTQEDDNRVHFVADADIDADGCPRAYNPQDTGLDALRNAGSPGNWYGLVTDRHGNPVVQSSSDPAPGYYVSSTAYQWVKDKNGNLLSASNPLKYIDAAVVPFIVVEGFIRNKAKGVVLGAKAKVTNRRNGKWVDCVVGDLGPLYKIGELSIAAALAIDIPSSPRTGGVSDRFIQYEIWPDTPAVVKGITYNLIPANN